MSRGFLPRQDVQFTGPTGRPTTPFYTWLQGLDAALKGGASVAEIQAEIDRLREMIADIPTTGFLPDTTNVFGQNSVITFGTLAGGVVLVELTGDVASPYPFQFYGVGSDRVRGWRWIYDALEAGVGLVQTMDGFNVVGVLAAVEDLPVSGTVGDAYLVAGNLWAWDGAAWIDEGDASGVTMFALAPLPDTGEGALLAITRDQYGRVEGTKDATITGTAGEIDVVNGDAVAGLPTISLADVADAGGGALQRTAFDAKGRKTGTSAATTDDLPEGVTNLYFTDERAQDAVEGMFDPAGSAAAALLAATTYTDDQLDPVNTKLATIEDGATVGADWSVNLTNIPANITSWAGIAPTAKADRAPISVSDWNVDIGAGNTGTEFGTGTGAAANAPSANGLLATSIKRSGTVGFMLGGAFSADQLWYRRMTGGAWQPWVRAWDASNFDPATKADATTVAEMGASCLAYPTVLTSVPTGVGTTIAMGAVTHDQLGAWSAGAPTRMTCVVAGFYRVSFSARFNAMAGGYRFAYITKNGSGAFAGRPGQRIGTSGSIDYLSSSSGILQCAAGDYFELVLTQDSGSSINSPASSEGTWLSLERVK